VTHSRRCAPGPTHGSPKEKMSGFLLTRDSIRGISAESRLPCVPVV
jgi:hypothetical protein